jgi:RNA polymerase sigma-70 factor, ECF subfamily
VQKDLCLEALRLALLVANHTSTRCPEAQALVALLAFHAARFEARTDIHGAIVLLPDQDRSVWNRDLIAEGERFLNLTQPAQHISAYHIEATIQWLHCRAPSIAHTNWPAILGLYNRLYELKPTPVVQLHMAVPVGKVFGPEKALELLGTLPLHGYYLFHAVQGEMLLELNRKTEAAAAYREAIALTQNDPERRLLQLKLEHCSEG